MNRRRRLGRIGEAFTPDPPIYQIENPSLFPAWVWLKPPEAYDAPRKRGGPIFELLAQMGFRVTIFEHGPDVIVPIHRPWTYVVLSVPAGDCGPWMESMADCASSVIMDCHFPIMNLETAMGADSEIMAVIDNKETILANLALADVVTVPQAGWAEALAEVNPNVFLLRDFSEARADEFCVRLVEIAHASVSVKTARQRARREMGL